jgi:hypothetical protein
MKKLLFIFGVFLSFSVFPQVKQQISPGTVLSNCGVGSASPTANSPSIGVAINITCPTYGASAGASNNATAIQAAINAAVSAGVPLYIPAAATCYKYTAPLTVTGNLTIIGDFVSGNWLGANGINLPVGNPLFQGSVLCPSSNGSNGITVTGAGNSLNLYNIVVEFQTPFSGTGHGIYYVPPLTAGNYQGLSGSVWNNVVVYGTDGNHYGYYLENFIYDTFIQVQGFGGGGFYLYGSNNGFNFGNSVFVNPYVQTIVGGSANAYNVDSAAAQTLNLITFVKPQAIVNNISGISPAGNLPTSAQQIFFMGTHPQAIRLVAPDFETNVGSPVTWFNGQQNYFDTLAYYSDASKLNITGGFPYGVLTPGPTVNINDATGSGSVALASVNFMPQAVVTASSPVNYGILAGLQVGAPTQGTNVTSSRLDAIYSTGEIYNTGDYAGTGGMFVGGTMQLNTGNGGATTEIADAGTSGLLTLGNTNNTTSMGSTTLNLPNIATVTTAQSGTVCRGTGGLLTYDPTNTCLVSSGRFKTHVENISEGRGIDEVMKLRPVSYFLDKPADPLDLNQVTMQIGFIAEDVNKVDPRLVTTTKDGELLSVRYLQMTAVLTKAIQDQQHEIDSLKRWRYASTRRQRPSPMRSPPPERELLRRAK